MNKLNLRDRFAYDLSKDLVHTGEVWDVAVINQSIETILTTSYGERVFNLGFGSPLQFHLFEGMNKNQGEKLVNEIIEAIKRWENRITISESDVRLIAEDNSYTLKIPYTININNIRSTFQKKIII